MSVGVVAPSAEHLTRPELIGDFGMTSATHWLAASASMSVLERGGNAFDAACAAGFVLQVVEPHLNGPAGEVPILLWSADENAAKVVCGQGVAPGALSIGELERLGLSEIPGTGLIPATVPGAFGAWTLLLERWGTWELSDVLSYAIGHARRGWPVMDRVSRQIEAVSQLFVEEWQPSAETWLRGSAAPTPGSRFTNDQLADTYERVLREASSATNRESRIAAARDVWYRGFVAEAIDAFAHGTEWSDTSGEHHGGFLRGDDLAAWAPSVEEPVALAYGGAEVLKTGPWGQGPVMLQQLAMLDSLGICEVPHLSAEWIHLVTETSKLANADREAWYGDPLFSDVPLVDLLSRDYALQRAQLVEHRASLRLLPGSPGGRAPKLSTLDGNRAGLGDAGTGEPTVTAYGRVKGDTCQVNVVDRWGNMVSATPSGGWLQSSPTIPELGFCLGTRGQMFWLEEGLPNSLRPGARPRTTLSPTLVLRDGAPWLAMGTPGGDQQDQWQLQLLLTVLHTGKNLQASIDAPTFHNLHAPSSFYPRDAYPGRLVVESRLDPTVVRQLEAWGHEVVVADPWGLGRLGIVQRGNDWLRAAADSRGGQGYALGR